MEITTLLLRKLSSGRSQIPADAAQRAEPAVVHRGPTAAEVPAEAAVEVAAAAAAVDKRL